jgi:hypothetical protein
MTKLQHLKRRLIRLSAISTGVVLAISVATWLASDYAASQEQAKRDMENKLQMTRSQIEQLEQKFNIYETSFNAYVKTESTLSEGGYTLDISKARKMMDALRTTYRISNLNAEISTQSTYNDSEEENAKYIGFEPVFRNVTLSLSALSDAHIYAFLEAIRQKLPGHVRFTKLQMARMKPLSDDVLVEISRGSTPALVNANVGFLWLGIAAKKKAEEEHAAP